MLKMGIVICAAFAFASSALAQPGLPNVASSVAMRAPRMVDGTPLVANPNACAPDRAEAVWDSHSKLVGYVCNVPNSN